MEKFSFTIFAKLINKDLNVTLNEESAIIAVAIYTARGASFQHPRKIYKVEFFVELCRCT